MKKKKEKEKCVQSNYENLYVKNRGYSTCTDLTEDDRAKKTKSSLLGMK